MTILKRKMIKPSKKSGSVSERGYSVRNRANTSPRDEAAFINGGTAGLDNTKKSSDKSSVVSKAKPVSIFFEENLKDIDALITAEMVSGKGRVNRSDVVRAAVKHLKHYQNRGITIDSRSKTKITP